MTVLHVIRDVVGVGVALWGLAIIAASLWVAAMSPRLAARFAGIQVVSMALTITGWFLLLPLAYCEASRLRGGKWHWPHAFWPWDDDGDGVDPEWWQRAHPAWPKARREYVWAAWRNSCNNLRYVRGFSVVGGPLGLKHFAIRGRLFYVKAGWQGTSGQPVMSAGAGRGW